MSDFYKTDGGKLEFFTVRCLYLIFVGFSELLLQNYRNVGKYVKRLFENGIV